MGLLGRGATLFGYVKPFKPMLRVCEFDTYQAIYCGLCKQLSRSYGPFVRLTLSYDFAFLALLGFSVQDDVPQFERQNCLYNPLKKKMCCPESAPLRFAADAAVLTLYHKVRDNITDERGFRRLGYRIIYPLVAISYKKACIGNKELDAFLNEQMKDQAHLEKRKCDSVDRAGEPTAQCLSKLFSMLTEDCNQKRVLERIGYLLGRWIYFIDAFDDLEEDMERGRYNPFLLRAQHLRKEGNPDIQDIDFLRKEALFSLNLTTGEIIKTFELLETKRYRTILENILSLGLKNVTDRVSSEQNQKKPHSK